MRGKQVLPGELALIETIRRSFPEGGRGVALGIGDDCAILRPSAEDEVVITTDFSLEGRHFLRRLHPSESVGHRCLARGLSDLAAMGARPLAAFLSLALPSSLVKTRRGMRWVENFLEGLRSLAKQANVPLAGGDTSASPADLVLADIVLVGTVRRGRALRRSGAHEGDAIYVTGSLGGAYAELTSQLAKQRLARVSEIHDHPHFFPRPRLGVGAALLRRGLATAAIDVSDGLSTDLMHLCKASALNAEIEAACIPLHPLAQKLSAGKGLDGALHGGEDYELLFTASPMTPMPRQIGGVRVTRIGTMRRGSGRQPRMTVINIEGRRIELKPRGWQHLV